MGLVVVATRQAPGDAVVRSVVGFDFHMLGNLEGEREDERNVAHGFGTSFLLKVQQ